MKVLKRLLILLICIFILYFVLFHLLGLETKIMRIAYPQEYSEFVIRYAEEYEVDPLLIFAMIKAESDFNPKAKSHNNAKGLMQLMDKTAIELSKQEEVDLYDPETNIQLGTYYFSQLLVKYENQTGIALAAYNAGMGNVNTWIERGTIKKDGSDLENIPYKETNMYVRRILNDYEIYQKLYEDSY